MESEKIELFKDFQTKEYPQFIQDAINTYVDLREKYPNDTHEDLDNILNALCGSIICLMEVNIDKSDHKSFLQVIWKTLNKNI